MAILGLSLFCLGLAPRIATLPSSMQEEVPRAQRRLDCAHVQYTTGIHSFGIAGGWVDGVAERAISGIGRIPSEQRQLLRPWNGGDITWPAGTHRSPPSSASGCCGQSMGGGKRTHPLHPRY